MWTLQSALKLIRETQGTAKSFGYHICLGGGVLNKGCSDKDLDIYFIPLVGIEANFRGLVESLSIGWPDIQEFGYSSDEEAITSFETCLRFYGTEPIDAFQGRLEVFIIAERKKWTLKLS